MDYFIDTEFIEDGRTIDLISLGIAASDGREIYLESAEADLSRANDWVKEHVLPHLGPVEARVSREAMRRAVVKFVDTSTKGTDLRFIADHASYDWVALCQLFGKMIDLPDGWPMFCHDLQQVLHEEDLVIEPPALSRSPNDIYSEMYLTHRPSYTLVGRVEIAREHHALADARYLREVWRLVMLHRRRKHGRV